MRDFKTFISYRRSDTIVEARSVYDFLVNHHGREKVFMDIDTMRAGINFQLQIHGAISQCDIVLVFIGPDWLARQDILHLFHRRIDSHKDFVRIEIETAFDRRKLVIPVLVRGASMPAARELPASLRELSFHQAVEVDPGAESQSKLIDKIEEALDFREPRTLNNRIDRRYGAENFRDVKKREADVEQRPQSSKSTSATRPPLVIDTTAGQATFPMADVSEGRRTNFRSRATSRTKQVVHLWDGESWSLDFETIEPATYEIYVRYSNDCLDGGNSIQVAMNDSAIGRIAATNTRSSHSQPGAGWDEFETGGPLGPVHLGRGRHTLSVSVSTTTFGIELDAIILKPAE